ncbi:flagellar basal body-associated FliL family protein [Rhizobium sp. KVB221]|uniref:Flagellar protein FliL n=1 Tax=Rhizobium setariae TaxID=2801340 RepID=A0A936YL15_9HYPH|nr:flagellar basal body-associated FliL family protein [Rhizobium setariae]MBL0370682.1 flagellar basal body-associated FliL family protein [Rhizobium setariae]
MVDTVDIESPKKKSALVMTIAAVAVVTAVAGAGGWFLGGMLAPAIEAADKAAEKAKAEAAGEGGATKSEDGLPRISTEENGVVQLEPITTNLSFPADRWIRLEVALLFKEKPDVRLAESIHQDILVYLRTVTLQQIEGPRGFQYLKEDLEERADVISEGKISKILFRSFVIE